MKTHQRNLITAQSST